MVCEISSYCYLGHTDTQISITDQHSISISRVPIPWLDHTQPLTGPSGDTVLRERQRLAVYPWSHPGHHHRHEFPGRSAGGGVRRSPALLHLLLQRPVLPQHHHTGELQLRAVRRHQAQGEDQPAALLLRGLKGVNPERRSVRLWTGAGLIQTVNGPRAANIGLISYQDCGRITGSIEASCGHLSGSETWSTHINLMTFPPSKMKKNLKKCILL